MSARVLVVGAGPAGMSAALWLNDLQIPFRWIEKDAQPGGTLRRVGNPISTYLGQAPEPGHRVATRLAESLYAKGIKPEFSKTLRNMRPSDKGWRAEIYSVLTQASAGGDQQLSRDPTELETTDFDAVLLCTGTRPRTLQLPREAELRGRGLEVSVNHNLERYAGKSVLVVGGGDAALEGALLLARACTHVHIAHRREAFRAQARFVSAVQHTPNITVHRCATLDALTTTTTAEGEHVDGAKLSNHLHLDVQGVFIRIGVQARIPSGVPSALIGPDGYISTRATGRTDAPRLYVAGDVGAPEHQSLAWASGSAARAVRAIADDLGFTH